MKKKVLASSFALVLILSSATAYAHPGRTDSNGGHYCRTNCAKWGLQDGEYHYHNGGGSSSSSSSSSNSIKSIPKKSTVKPKAAKPAYKESGLRVYVNGNKLSFSSAPLIYQNTNLVPLREIAEGLGATLNYDNNSGTIGVTKGNSKMTLTIGSKIVFYNGSSETVSAAPKVIKGVTYVPGQVFARGLGAGIELDSINNSLKITY
ncbi:copper amine oxidase N-terminal domain-containing protein [Paenibacillus polymyxa]|uniref:copper amine oxidase N-terminal domain-containing protein n=1 Tax=Paenibacillus polymyxa TaxID=1406 RepID=UPI0007EBC554|nr:copper amine oxidase N-terminal domain-containing protein [Paenibacillus polymyxa]OAZ48483.1 copper amine oxidase [Paenibacillus polymyxa]